MPDLIDRHIIDTTWLASHLGAPGLVIVDASLHLASTGRRPRDEFHAAHIPGAAFFDIENIADTASPLPNMLPSAETFAAAMTSLGISSETAVVAYDGVGLYSAARAWWMLRTMGHDNVAVLDGGLPKWRAEGRPITVGDPATGVAPAAQTGASFAAIPRPALVRSLDDVASATRTKAEQIVDARAEQRFAGTTPEPRAGLRAGHIPGSHNVPFTSLVAADGTLLPPSELRDVFALRGVDPAQPVVASCGSGVTAGIVALALALLGNTDAAVYDGSWTEWGDVSSPTEVETTTVAR